MLVVLNIFVNLWPTYVLGFIFTIALVVIIFRYLHKYARLNEVPYDYDEMDSCTYKLIKGETIHLTRIKDPDTFVSFLIEAEFHKSGIGSRLIHTEPTEETDYYIVKLIDEEFNKTKL